MVSADTQTVERTPLLSSSLLVQLVWLVLYEVSRLLNCPLDRDTLALAVQLLDNGANPEALAAVITELHNEARRLKPAN